VTIDVRKLGQVEYLPTYEAMKVYTADRYDPRALQIAQNTPQTSLQPNEHGRNQLWICEHPAVYTQGLAGKVEHILNPGNIPVVQTDRGGQVTFHGPGQVVAYPLMDLKAAGYYVKEYVYRVEEAVIRTLMHFGVTGHRVRGAPGIYVRLDDPFSHAMLDTGAAKVKGSEPKWGSDPVAKRSGSNPHLGSDPMFSGLGKIAALGIKVSRHCTYHGVALNVAMDLEPFSRINPCGYAGLQTLDLRTIGVSVTWQDTADVLSQKLASYLAP
jgi:lipoyl(octanoyl) transferase